TATERRATLAERDSSDRYLALYLQHRIGELFQARVSGVTKFGLFVTLAESGASGFLAMANLPDDYWMYDEATQTLSGRRSRSVFSLAQKLEVRLNEARPVTGGLLFSLSGAPGRATQRPGRAKSAETHKVKPKQKRRR
ncbi:MAG: S1 RNA-binding domain-containing protein, partial [Acidocella sp.]|nr:S1 RNA-binding domain-containing protein [Acidocella sp.]